MDLQGYRMPPGKIADNLWHIGVKGGPSYLLQTSAGLVLIDTAFPQTVSMLLENIRALGFDPCDIRHILHSHGHYDHVGGTRALVELTAAKTYIGAPDADAVAGRNALVYAEEMEEDYTPDRFEADVLLYDGDALEFGDTTVRCLATPGHTAGTLSFFWNVRVGGRSHLAGMFGGAGLNSLTAEYLQHRRLPFTLREQFLASIERALREPVELHVGNHLSDNNYRQKLAARMPNYEPFLAENTYRSFLKNKYAEAKAFFALPEQQKGNQL